MTTSSSRPIALTIAGSDSSGGAGIQADLKAFGAMGVYGASVITALTAQNTTGVQGVYPIPTEFVAQQIKSVMDDLSVAAIKTGMLANADIITTVAAALDRGIGLTIVVDPVMVATSGDLLLEMDAVAAVRDIMLPRADLITPNLGEAAQLLAAGTARSRREMEQQAEALLAFGPAAVLLKGGHFGEGEQAADVLVTAAGARWYEAEWIDTPNTHGTGCTLASAIAAQCARGVALGEAVAAAKAYLTRALAAGAGLKVGHGHGPVDHLVDMS
jgi:hydroxymethylpyrimidine/phosphomethylpyrimidine kinase